VTYYSKSTRVLTYEKLCWVMVTMIKKMSLNLCRIAGHRALRRVMLSAWGRWEIYLSLAEAIEVASTSIYTCVCVCVCVCVYIYTYTYIHVYVCIHTYICIQIYVCMHTYIYTFIHTYIRIKNSYYMMCSNIQAVLLYNIYIIYISHKSLSHL